MKPINGFEVTVVRVTQNNRIALTRPYVETYQAIFAAPPWNEYRGCTQDRNLHPVHGVGSVQNSCDVCGSDLSIFWPASELEADLKTITDDPSQSLHLMIWKDRVIGFTVGHAQTVESMDQTLELEGVGEALKSVFGIDNETLVGYQKDIALLPEFQGRHLARHLVEPRRHCFDQNGCKIVVARTMGDPGNESVTYKWYNRDGYQIVARYNDARSRVIQAKVLQ